MDALHRKEREISQIAEEKRRYEQVQQAALEAEMNGHLAKPIDAAQLRAAITRLLQ